jgi:hypothetical protein
MGNKIVDDVSLHAYEGWVLGRGKRRRSSENEISRQERIGNGLQGNGDQYYFQRSKISVGDIVYILY